MAKVHHVVRERVSFISQVGCINHRTHNTLTLKDALDVLRIHVGMFLRAGVSHEHLRCGALEVLATNEESGTVTVAAANAVTSLCDGDLLFWVSERP